MTSRFNGAARRAQYAGFVPGSLVGSLREITANLLGDSDMSHTLTTITHACAELLGASATVVTVVGALGEMRVLTASPDDPATVALFEKHADDGPWAECHRAGRTAGFADLIDAARRWPDIAAAAVGAHCRAAFSVPMLLAGDPVGALTLVYAAATQPSAQQLELARCLADLATLSLCQESKPHRAESLARHTLTLLNDRVQLEHAIGMVAGGLDVSVSDAHTTLRRHAHARKLPLSELARSIALGSINIRDLAH
jgi:transcriptional regulator with GAF, ATPase, and Fis domain